MTGERGDRDRDHGRPGLKEPYVLVATWIYALVTHTCHLCLPGLHCCISIQCCCGFIMQIVVENYILPWRRKKKKDKQQKE